MIFSNAFSEWIYYNSGEYVPAGLFVGLALVALVLFRGGLCCCPFSSTSGSSRR